MSRAAFEFLARSPLWSSTHRDDAFARLTDEDLRRELAAYRTHILGGELQKAKGMSVAVSARQGNLPNDREIKQSVLYFDEVLLPDPVFDLTEWTRERVRMPAESDEPPREELVSAVRLMQELAPLVRLGRVRFVPTTHVLEPPEHLAVLFPDDLFESLVPEPLRAWFRERAVIRKVVVDHEKRQRLVLASGPDRETSSILVHFGQIGPAMTYDNLRPAAFGEDRMVLMRVVPPDTDDALRRWIAQSTNKSAGEFLRQVSAEVENATILGCSFVTSCQTTADLLDHIGAPVASNREYGSSLSLELPMVETASIEQLARLIERESSAFEALRLELRTTVDSLSAISDPGAFSAEAKTASTRLAREQVHEVERKLLEAQRSLKYSLPITAALLAAAGLGFAATGGIAAGLAALCGSAAAAASTVKEHQAHRGQPGYFLWKLRKTGGS